MSVREDDRNKSSTSRGLGLAAAAIGVGVGAALYYLYNRTTETPHSGNSSTDVDREKAFDTSEESTVPDSNSTSFTDNTNSDSSFDSPSAPYSSSNSIQTDITDSCSDSTSMHNYIDSNEDVYSISESSVNSDSENGYRIRTASTASDYRNESSEFSNSFDTSNLEDILERAMLNARAETDLTERFRERSWSLEECTVCCDVMLRNQELEMLPCGHQFHASCIRPWLNERTTCPNCRKTA